MFGRLNSAFRHHGGLGDINSSDATQQLRRHFVRFTADYEVVDVVIVDYVGDVARLSNLTICHNLGG